MIKQAFLTREEIKALQDQEAASTKEQKRTAEQIDAIYSSGTNILVSASAGSGKTFVMVQRILDQIQRGISIKELFISTFTVKAAGELKERLESELGKALQASDDPELKQHLARQIADVATSDIGTMDSFTQKVLTRYGYLLGLAPQFRILQNASEQRLLQNEVFQAVFDRYYQGENQEAFVSKTQQMKEVIRKELANYPDVTVFSGEDHFAPHILTFGIKGVRGEVVVHAFEEFDIYISTTSACSSKAGKPAGTLIAMGVDKSMAQTAVRLSLDLENDMSQVEQFLTKFKLIYEQTRKVR